MNCAWCGHKKGLLEHFTRFGFCHRCDTLVRGQIKEQLARLSYTADLCDARMLRQRAGSGIEPADSDLLRRLDEALAIIQDLETIRVSAPFFKSSTDSARTSLLLCRAILPGAPALPSAAEAEALPPAPGGEGPAAFRALLAGLEQIPLPPLGLAKRAPMRNPTSLGRLTCAQIAAASDVDKLGSYVALDVKTTGTNPRRAEIIAVSAVRFESFVPRAVFSTLVIPRRPIPPRAAQRCGVDNEMVRGMPLIEEIIPTLRDFLGGDRLVGYNLLAELPFLFVHGIDPPKGSRMLYDILSLARSFLSAPDTLTGRVESWRGYDVPDYSLSALCDHYDICYEERYRPGADCLSLGLLFAALVRDRVSGSPK